MDEAESTDYSSHGKVFMGSVVTSGEGYMIATVIGDSSELGKINKALTDTSEEEERKDTSSLKLEGVAAGIGKLGVSAAAIAGILLNAILPGNDYSFGKHPEGDRSRGVYVMNSDRETEETEENK